MLTKSFATLKNQIKLTPLAATYFSNGKLSIYTK